VANEAEQEPGYRRFGSVRAAADGGIGVSEFRGIETGEWHAFGLVERPPGRQA